MSLSGTEYKNLYKLQEIVLQTLPGYLDMAYLTGGTALARFYLKHRYSDDLDFFFNNESAFEQEVSRIISKLHGSFQTDPDKHIYAPDFKRIWLIHQLGALKVEFVNDISARWGDPIPVNQIQVDNPANILANKLTAIPGREEPKDVFDIVRIALSYSFNWRDVMEQSLKKALVAEEDVAMFLSTFPVTLLKDQPWLPETTDLETFSKNLQTLVDDFLMARDNSLGKGKPPITEASPMA